MQTRHESILRTINSNKKYNILTAPTHESYWSNHAKSLHIYYMLQYKGFKTWDNNYRKMPENHILLDGSENQIKTDMQFDIVLSQNKFGQFQVLNQIAQKLNIPLINIEHTLPVPNWGKLQMQSVKNMRGDINVFISEYSIEKWGFSLDDPSVRIVHHAINTDLFKPNNSIEKQNYSFSCCNDLINRDWCCGYQIWRNVSSKVPNRLIGATKGLSEPSKSVQDLVNEYNKAKLFFNHSLISPIPTVVLEAMSCGLPVVSTNNCMLPEVIKHGYNGFLTNNENEMIDYIDLLLKDDKLRVELGTNARKTILEKFTIEKHLNSWNDIFDEVAGRGHNS